MFNLKQIDAKKSQLSDLNKENILLKSKVKEFEDEAVTQIQQIDGLKKALSSLKTSGKAENAKQEDALSGFDEMIKTLKSQLKDARLKAESAQQQQYTLEEEKDILEREKDKLEDSTKHWKDECEKAKAQINEYELKASDAENEHKD